jgi:hypothetical protein
MALGWVAENHRLPSGPVVMEYAPVVVTWEMAPAVVIRAIPEPPPNHRAPSGPLVMASGRASAFPHRKRRDLARCGDPADGVSRVLSRWRTRTRIRSVHAD